MDLTKAESGQAVKAKVDGKMEPGIIVKRDFHMGRILFEYAEDGDLKREWVATIEVEDD